MSLHAVDDIEDAFTATRELLRPFEFGRWARLALVAFFIGAGTSAPTPSFDLSIPGDSNIGTDTGPDLSGALPEEVGAAVAVLVAGAVLVGLLWTLVGSILEFVLVESLRSREVTVRRYWGLRWRQGLRLFGFRLALGGSFLVVLGAWLAVVLSPVLFDADTSGLWLAVLLVGLPLVLVVGLVVAVVYQFTTVFVVPVMIEKDSGVLAAWRGFWPTLRREWREFLVYALVAAVLTGVLGLAVSLALGVVTLVALVPLGGVALLAHLTVSLSSTAGLALLVVLGGVFVVVLAGSWAALQVPVVAYLRYYALFVLGDCEPAFDLIPAQRADIRAGR